MREWQGGDSSEIVFLNLLFFLMLLLFQAHLIQYSMQSNMIEGSVHTMLQMIKQ